MYRQGVSRCRERPILASLVLSVNRQVLRPDTVSSGVCDCKIDPILRGGDGCSCLGMKAITVITLIVGIRAVALVVSPGLYDTRSMLTIIFSKFETSAKGEEFVANHCFTYDYHIYLKILFLNSAFR